MNINDKNIITLKDGWDFYIPKVKSDEKDNDLVNKIRSLVDLLYVPIPKKANNEFRIPKKVLPLYLNDCAQPYNTQLTHSLGILRNENNEKIFLEEINYLNGRLENQFTFDIRDQFEFSTYLNDAYFNNWITETELSEESRLLCEDSIKIFEDAYEIIKEKFPDAPFFKSATKINVLFFENNGLPYQARYPNHIDIASNKWVEDSKERRELLALHEVFHIVQFNLRSYSHVARNWFLEGTASWLETHKYKAVSTINKIDDYFESSHKNLEISSYGTLVFWMFIEDLLKKEGEKNPIFQYIDTIIEVAPPEEGKFVLMPALKLLIQRLNPALNFDLVFFDFAKKFIQIDWRAKIGVRSSRDELAYYNFNFTTDEFILDAYASFFRKAFTISKGSIEYIVIDLKALRNKHINLTFSCLDENGPFNIAFIPSDYIKINPIEAVGDTIEKLDVSSSFIFSSAAPLNYNYLIAVVISVGTVINNSYEISIEVV